MWEGVRDMSDDRFGYVGYDLAPPPLKIVSMYGRGSTIVVGRRIGNGVTEYRLSPNKMYRLVDPDVYLREHGGFGGR
jgi:hypothetical protein